eukprot:1183213-Prorocentrum_minimum.AAC.2
MYFYLIYLIYMYLYCTCTVVAGVFSLKTPGSRVYLQCRHISCIDTRVPPRLYPTQAYLVIPNPGQELVQDVDSFGFLSHELGVSVDGRSRSDIDPR